MQPRSRTLHSADRKDMRSDEELTQLLLSLKNTVEGLLANCPTHVWNTYGGLSRLCSDVERILNHRLRTSEGIFDYWQFLCGVRWLKPVLEPSVLKENPHNRITYPKSSEGLKWLNNSLQEFVLSSQLEELTSVKDYLLSYYDDEAFLCNEEYTRALLICLKAVEQNKPELLAELNPALVVKQVNHVNNVDLNQKGRKTCSYSQNFCDANENYEHSLKMQPFNVERVMSSLAKDTSLVHSSNSQSLPLNLRALSSATYESYNHLSEITAAEKKKKGVKVKKGKNVRNCKLNKQIFNVKNNPKIRTLDRSKSYKIATISSPLLTINRWQAKKFSSNRCVKKASLTSSKVNYSDSQANCSINVQQSLGLIEILRTPICRNKSLQHFCYNAIPQIKFSSCRNTKFSSCPNLKSICKVTLCRSKSANNICSVKTVNIENFEPCTAIQTLKKLTPDDTDSEFYTCDEASRELSSRHLTEHSEKCEISSSIMVGEVQSTHCGQTALEKDLFSKKPISALRNTTSNSLASPLLGKEMTWKAQHTRSRSDIPHLSHAPLPTGADSIDGRSLTPPPLSSSLPCSLVEKHRKSLIEDDSPIMVPTEFFFPRPHQGQSLTSFLSSKDFTTCAELDKENAHFCISEALISAIEQMKCNQSLKHLEEEEDDSDEVIMELKQKIRIRRRERQQEKTRSRAIALLSDGKTDTTTSPSASSPFSSTHSSASGLAESSGTEDDVEELELSDPNESKLVSIKENGLSLSLASLYSDADIQPAPVSSVVLPHMNEDLSRSFSLEPLCSQLSAETVALCLLKKFSEKQLPKASELEWLVSEQDAPQRLLPLPDSWPVSPDIVEEEYSLEKTRLRGNLEWAPPRAQIIFNIHPAPKRKVLIAKQNYRCAGCGMKIDRNYISRFRYCEYLGKYFCQCCHSNNLAFIPGRILRKWDFTKHYVSKFSWDLLDRMFCDPLFNVVDLNSTLYRKVRQLDSVREYRVQLFYIKDYINTCRKADKLKEELNQEPSHLINEQHMYSLYDLLQVKSGDLSQHLCHLIMLCVDHIKECPFCQAKGFICEICNIGNDIIFPFQLGKVSQCQECGSCFHKKCYSPGKCPRCVRIKARKKKLEDEPHHLSSEEDS